MIHIAWTGGQTTAGRCARRSCIPETATELSAAAWIVGQRNRRNPGIVPADARSLWRRPEVERRCNRCLRAPKLVEDQTRRQSLRLTARLAQLRLGEIFGVGQVGIVQVGTDQVGAAQVGADQVGAAQVGAASSAMRQIAPFGRLSRVVVAGYDAPNLRDTGAARLDYFERGRPVVFLREPEPIT